MVMKNMHAERAVDYYSRNFNCTQGVFTTYAIEHGIDEKLALKLATNFGGGARKGEMCGAVSGALMVLGLLYGHSESDDLDTKTKAYAMAEEYMNRFIKKNGSAPNGSASRKNNFAKNCKNSCKICSGSTRSLRN